MAKKKTTRGTQSGGDAASPGDGREGGGAPLRFSRVNAALVLAGLVTIGVGYYLLAQGSVTAAPILLVLGYVILLPLGLIL